MSNSTEPFSELSDNIKQYVRTTIEIIKLEVIQRVAVIIAYFIYTFFKLLLFGMSLLMLSISIGLYLSEYLNNYAKGFAIVGVFYLLIFLIIYFVNRSWIEKNIQNNIIRNLFKNENL
jgi:hypothetical protein